MMMGIEIREGDYLLTILNESAYISYKGIARLITHEEMLKRLYDMNYQYLEVE
jgi:hypothetical protein